MTEVFSNKKSYNARKRELLANGYRQTRDRGNWEEFYKKGEEVVIRKGWMKQ